MSKFENVNLTPIGNGVILALVMEKQEVQTASGILTVATQNPEMEYIWKGVCEVVKIGPDCTQVKPGDKVHINMKTNHKVVFEHKEHKLLWTVEQVIFAVINPESKIVL